MTQRQARVTLLVLGVIPLLVIGWFVRITPEHGILFIKGGHANRLLSFYADLAIIFVACAVGLSLFGGLVYLIDTAFPRKY